MSYLLFLFLGWLTVPFLVVRFAEPVVALVVTVGLGGRTLMAMLFSAVLLVLLAIASLFPQNIFLRSSQGCLCSFQFLNVLLQIVPEELVWCRFLIT